MSYQLRLTREAEDDLMRLYDFVLERELDRPGTGDLDLAEKALHAIKDGFMSLNSSPFTCRKADQSPFLRELIIPFGRSGYVALFEILDSTLVVIAAVRHQLEDDYH
ncbi:MAG: type II toxin-antitoxin system RelE/ParE family toxin [Polaromonas sp.]